MKQKDLYTGSRFRAALRAFLIGKSAQGIANFVLTLWLVRLLLPADYGAYMALWGMLELLVPLSSLGLLEAVRRYMPDLAMRGTASGVRVFVKWSLLVRFSVISAWVIAIWMSWSWFTDWLGFTAIQTEQTKGVPLLLLTVLVFRFTSEILETLLEQKWSQLAQALQPLGRLAGVAVLVSMGAVSLENILWIDIVVSLFCLSLAEIALMRRLSCLELNGSHTVQVREVASFATHMMGSNLLLATASMGALRLMAARLLGLEAAGLFAFLQQLISIVNRYMPAQMLANIIRPMLITRRAAGNAGEVNRGVALLMKSNLLIVLAGISAFAVAGDSIIAVASGGSFPDAGSAMLLFLVALGATSQGQLIAMTMQIFDQTRQLFVQSFLVLLVPIAAWVGGREGILCMIAGIAMSYWFRNSYAIWWMGRYGEGLLLDIQGALRAILATGLALLPGLLLAPSVGPWVALVLTLVCLVLGFRFAKPLSLEDEFFLSQILKGKESLLRSYVYRG